MWGIEMTKHLAPKENQMIDEATSFYCINETTKIEYPLRANFSPKPDITAYELAILLPYLLGRPLYQKACDELPQEVKRHLVFEE